MKCPKCGYLGFESVDRCRNCGYDFSLSPAADVLELPLRPPPTPAPVAPPPAPASQQPAGELSFLDEFPSEPVRFSSTAGAPRRAVAEAPAPDPAAGDLPLFGTKIPDDAPLITKAPPPRPPLAVRRATPEAPRLRTVPARTASLDLGLDGPSTSAASSAPAGPSEFAESAADVDQGLDAAVGARFAAFLTDMLILAAIDLVVVYFTMQICGVGLSDLDILPRAPLVAFLLVQNVGYLVAFTAGGQTIGKMAAGIKVVSAESLATLDFGRAFLREVVWIVLAAPAGLGLLTVLSRDRRGVHDRIAGARVVRS